MTIELMAYKSTELATLVLPPCTVEEISVSDNVIQFTSRSRLSQYLYYDGYFLRGWVVTVPHLTTAQKASLETFWRARNGRVVPFKWYDTSSSEGVFVRFIMEKLAFRPIFLGHWSCTFELQEAHPLEIDNEESSGSPWFGGGGV